MKTLMRVIALVALVSAVATAQPNTSWNDGVTHYLGPKGTSTDSVHVIGTISLLKSDGYRKDSVAFLVSYQDSARIALRLKLLDAFGTVSDTATVNQVAGDKIIDATAAGSVSFPWFNVKAALGDKIYGCSSIVVEAIVYQVGTEVLSSGKKFNVRAKSYE